MNKHLESAVATLRGGLISACKHPRVRQVGIWAVLALLGAFVVNVSLIGIFSGALDTSEGNEGVAPDSDFTLAVKDGVQVSYKTAATFAPVLLREITEPVLGKPAQADARNVCTHSRRGKVSSQTGGSYYLTKFKGHWNRRHHTKTYYMVNTASGYQPRDSWTAAPTRRYCGCN